jgi:hypothetical protein
VGSTCLGAPDEGRGGEVYEVIPKSQFAFSGPERTRTKVGITSALRSVAKTMPANQTHCVGVIRASSGSHRYRDAKGGGHEAASSVQIPE